MEHYRVLSLFIKYYNKWYVAGEEKVKWVKVQKSNKARNPSTYGVGIWESISRVQARNGWDMESGFCFFSERCQ